MTRIASSVSLAGKVSIRRMQRGLVVTVKAATIALVIVHGAVASAAVFTSTASGTWQAAATWDMSPYPQAGDEIRIGNHAISLAGNEVFGGAATASDYTGTNQVMNLGANTLTHQAGGSFDHSSVGGYLIWQGAGGTFQNDGTYIHSSPNLNYIRGINFQNNNLLQLTGGNDFRMDELNSTLNNPSGSFIIASGGGGGIDGDGGTNDGIVVNAGTIRADAVTMTIDTGLTDTGGTIEATNGGVLRMSGQSSGVGQPVSTSASTTFDGNNGGQVQLGGTISALRGSRSGNVVIGGQLGVSGATGFIDLTGPAIDWEGNTIQSTLGGNTLELRSDARFTGVTLHVLINGELRIAPGATLERANGGGNANFHLRNDMTLNVDGTLRMTGASVRMDNADATINNNSLILGELGSSSIVGESTTSVINNFGIVRANGAGAILNIQSGFVDNGFTIEAINDGVVQFSIISSNTALSSGVITSPSTSFDGNTGGQVRLGGKINALRGTISGDTVIGGGMGVDGALGFIDLSGPIDWIGYAQSSYLGGNVLELRSPVTFTGASLHVVNDGILRNVAGNTFERQSATGANFHLRSDAKFENAGTYLMNDTGTAAFQMDNNGNAELENTGLMRVQTGNWSVGVNGIGTKIFDNQGTLELLTGTSFTMDTDASVPQYNGSDTLTGGTWRILAEGTDTTTLNLDPADAGITAIGAGATVVLSEAAVTSTATFSELGLLTDVSGGLFVHGEKSLTLDGGGVTASGTIGGDGTLVAAGGIDLSGGSLMPGTIDGLGGTLAIQGNVLLDTASTVEFKLAEPGEGGLNDLIEIDGDLRLDGTLEVSPLAALMTGSYRLFNYTGILDDQGLTSSQPELYLIDTSTPGQVNLLLVPEPSSVCLLALGILGAVRLGRSRRRKM